MSVLAGDAFDNARYFDARSQLPHALHEPIKRNCDLVIIDTARLSQSQLDLQVGMVVLRPVQTVADGCQIGKRGMDIAGDAVGGLTAGASELRQYRQIGNSTRSCRVVL
jgi:hypothetical protein